MIKPMEDLHVFGTVKVGERGQIVIPKEARDMFEISPGDLVMIVGRSEMGTIGILKADNIKEMAMKIIAGLKPEEDE